MNAAVIGTGRMGQKVVSHLFGTPHLKDLFIYDISPEAMKECAAIFPWVKAATLENILENPEISLIYITSSNDSHFAIATEAMRRGKSVMCEKPMATTLRDSSRMLSESDNQKAYLQIGFELRYSRLYTSVKRWIDEGLLGRIASIQCTYICSEFHHKNSWRNKTISGGSMFGEKLSHYADLCRWFMGDEVEDVFTACAPNVVKYFEVHDNYQTTMRFKAGGVAHITFMMNLAAAFEGDPLQNPVDQQQDDGHELRFLIVGENGAAETDVFRRRLKRWEFTDTPQKLHSTLVESLTWSGPEDHTYFHNTTDQARDIASRIAHAQKPLTDPHDSFETMILCEAAERSAATGTLVKLSALREELGLFPHAHAFPSH